VVWADTNTLQLKYNKKASPEYSGEAFLFNTSIS